MIQKGTNKRGELRDYYFANPTFTVVDDECVGCNLCSLVCPVENCITMVRKDDGLKDSSWSDRSLTDDVPTSFNDERAGGNGHYVPQPSDALKHRK